MEMVVYGLVMMVASVLISAALAPKQVPPPPAAFEDFDFPIAEDGTPICVVFGDCWIPDWTVLAVGNYRTTAIKSKSGKK